MTENISGLPIAPQQKNRFTRKYDMNISVTKTGVMGPCRESIQRFKISLI
jgi:hypothetical protein